MDLDLFIRTYGYRAVFGGMVIQQLVPPIPVRRSGCVWDTHFHS